MGFACNGTWQESDPDACLQVPAGGASIYQGSIGGASIEIHRNSAE